MVEYIKEQDSLNTGRKTINEELTRSNNNADKAKIDSAEALLKAIASMDLSESVRNQLNQILIEGDSSVEAAAARVDEKNVTHDTLKERIDDGFLGVTSQLNDEVNNRFYNNLSLKKKPIGMISIQDDDTNKRLYTDFFPILQDLKVKITAAAITGRIESNHVNTITKQQFAEMRDSGLVEFISHTETHRHLADMPLWEAEQELVNSRNWLIRNGGNADYLVPPFASDNDDVKELIKKYYRGSFKAFSSNYFVSPPVNTYSIRRVDFERGLSEIKGAILQAKQNDQLLIINTHSSYSTLTTSDFREMLEYAISNDVPIKTTGEAMEHFGNLLEIDSNPLSPNLSLIDANGVRHGVLDTAYWKVDATNITFNTPITFNKFRSGVTVCHFTSSLASSYGWPSAGMLETHKYSDNYAYQRFTPVHSNSVLHRYWNEGVWSDFIEIAAEITFKLISRSGITFDTPVSNFPNGVSVAYFNNSAATSAGFPTAGLLYTHHIGSDGSSHQEYVSTGSVNRLKRYWRSSGWSQLLYESGSRLTTNQRTSLDTSDLPVGYFVFDSGLSKPVWWTGTKWVDALGSDI